MRQRFRAFLQGLSGSVLASLLALPGSAAAQDTGNQYIPLWYVGPVGGYTAPDSARDAEYGINAGIILGAVLADSLAVELNAFGTELTRESDNKKNDYVYGGGLDLTLGTPAPGNPFFVIGGGWAQQDVLTVKKGSGYGNLGLGVYLPFQFGRELWRVEARYGVIFNDHPAFPATEELLEDGRINIGVLFGFGEYVGEYASEDDESGALAAPVAAAPPPPPPADADGDGVPDASDRCPDTPRWVRPDANGCTPDTDGDGIDETKDCCPGTAAGTSVDASGCEPRPAPEPVQLADEDRDGVIDSKDACPHTPRLEVDEKGCIQPEEASLKNIHFDLESSRLTADAYPLLRALAATMKAEPGLVLEVAGHADATGSESFNKALSRERAEVVRDFLSYAGVPEGQLKVGVYGESAPSSDNKTAEGRAYNRRVEFRRVSQ